jgi:hypothetical protein
MTLTSKSMSMLKIVLSHTYNDLKYGHMSIGMYKYILSHFHYQRRSLTKFKEPKKTVKALVILLLFRFEHGAQTHRRYHTTIVFAGCHSSSSTTNSYPLCFSDYLKIGEVFWQKCWGPWSSLAEPKLRQCSL